MELMIAIALGVILLG
ncbi:MAG: hypothetical protein ACRDAF_14350, partial [Aeromonas veronii]